jgi:hypothetical protein
MSEDVDWTNMVQERDQWRAVVAMVTDVSGAETRLWNFLEQLCDCKFRKKDSVSWNQICIYCS